MSESKAGGSDKLRKLLIVLAVLAVPVLAVLGVEAWRQVNEASSIEEVEHAYEGSLEYFDNPDDWNQYFRTRREGTCGYDQYHDWGRDVKAKTEPNGEVRTWAVALLEESTETPPTNDEATKFLADSRPLVADARKLLKYDYLDGAAQFQEGGDAAGDLDGIYGLRMLQTRVAILHERGERAAAMNDLELLLELTSRLQQPFGLLELLLMQVVEPDTMLAAGRMAETGPLSPKCRELIRTIAEAPESRESVAAGELAYFAWMYREMGTEALSGHSKGGVNGGTSGWFHWFGKSGFTGAADLNREIAADQQALLEYCRALKAGEKPAANTGMPAGLESNLRNTYGELHMQRGRMVFVIRVREALDGGDPKALNAEILKAGMLLEKQQDNWKVSFKYDEARFKELQISEQDFKKRFPPLLLRP